MVQVVRSHVSRPNEPAPMRFNVFLSPLRRRTVLGNVEPYGVIHGSSYTWLQMPFGVPVTDDLTQAVELARRAGVLVIDDPDGLIPTAT